MPEKGTMFSLSKQLEKYFSLVILMLGMCGSGTAAKPLLDDWQMLTSSTVNTVRYHHEAIAMNGYIYIIGGQVGYADFLNSIERAKLLPNGTLGQWITISCCSETRGWFSIVTVGKWMYLIGGEYDYRWIDPYFFRYSNVERAEIYPVHGTFSQWTVIRDLPYHITKHAAVSYGKYIYLLGGFVAYSDSVGYDSNSVFRAEVYADGSISEFTAETAAMLRDYYMSGSALVLRDFIFIFGGEWPPTSVERAKILPDGHLGAWMAQNSTLYWHNTARCAVSYDTFVFQIAGDDLHYFAPVEYATLDTSGNLSEWKLANVINYYLYGTSAVLSYPYIYVTGGYASTFFITDAFYTRFARLTAIEPKQTWELYQ